MTTRERIHAEVESIPDEELDDLYELVTRFASTREAGPKRGLLSRLRQIRIDAPADFSANFDLYASGKEFDGNVVERAID